MNTKIFYQLLILLQMVYINITLGSGSGDLPRRTEHWHLLVAQFVGRIEEHFVRRLSLHGVLNLIEKQITIAGKSHILSASPMQYAPTKVHLTRLVGTTFVFSGYTELLPFA